MDQATETQSVMSHEERLLELFSVIHGVPDDKVDLRRWRTYRDAKNGALEKYDWGDTSESLRDCGTLACAGGWACAYPPFVAQGLGYRCGPRLHKKYGFIIGGYHALAEFFGLTFDAAYVLFRPAHRTEFRHTYRFGQTFLVRTDREIFLVRLLTYLLDRGIINQARANAAAIATFKGSANA